MVSAAVGIDSNFSIHHPPADSSQSATRLDVGLAMTCDFNVRGLFRSCERKTKGGMVFFWRKRRGAGARAKRPQPILRQTRFEP